MTVQAPAKVNLTLRILGKRPDGYHDIETLMVPISLSDEMKIEISDGEGIELVCDDADIPTGPGNLVWKAVEIFSQSIDRKFFTKIFLQKKIPHGAGLAGGSSNAAATLKALDNLLGTRLGDGALEELAAQLGSDVPFFIKARPAICSGRGEVMKAAPEISGSNILLLKPPFPVSTAWAYQEWSRNPARAVSRQTFSGIDLVNDLEGPVFKKFLLLPSIKAWLLEQEEVSAAMMSGSGSTLFALLHGDAVNLAAKAKAQFGQSLWTTEAAIQS